VAALWLLTGLFFLRVLGQVLVALLQVRFLPPMSEWYSGLIPYSVLLPIQLAILALMAKINLGLSSGAGLFAIPRRGLGRFLRGFSIVSFLAMVARYAIGMALHPGRRWLGGTIPTTFHWVLAAYLFLWALVSTRAAAEVGR
jgi:hypothetical protein